MALSAVLSGVKDIRDAVARAENVLQQSGRATILFVDEVHRFNKAQQDAFLPFVERGLVTFIGATTENPSFEVNGALLSRAAVYVLKPLGEDDLAVLFQRAFRRSMRACRFSGKAQAIVIAARRRRCAAAAQHGRSAWQCRRIAKHLLQWTTRSCRTRWRRICAASTRAATPSTTRSRRCTSRCAAPRRMRRCTGSPACSTAAPIPLYLGRRLVRMAVEDIGLADPRALRLALDACETYERLGTPEGELALAEAAIYLACAPKSNAAYVAYNAARAHVQSDKSRPVPEHLRNAPTKLMKELGYGRTYRYAHDEPDAYAAGENYLPEGLEGVSFYQPTSRGLEGKLAEKLAQLRELDSKAKKKD